MEKLQEKNEILELYKLHCELADRVSQRRDSANRLYVSLLTSILIFIGVFIRFNVKEIPIWAIVCVGSTVGVALAFSWFVIIRSYRQLNSGKFAALDELESKLVYSFFRREWEILGERKNRKKYWELTVVETFLPIIFSILFIVITIISFCFL